MRNIVTDTHAITPDFKPDIITDSHIMPGIDLEIISDIILGAVPDIFIDDVFYFVGVHLLFVGKWDRT
jgi:hypothetical protein